MELQLLDFSSYHIHIIQHNMARMTNNEVHPANFIDRSKQAIASLMQEHVEQPEV
jgi:hypothetical protein